MVQEVEDLQVAGNPSGRPVCWPWSPYSATIETDFRRIGAVHPVPAPDLPHVSVVGSLSFHNRQELATALGIEHTEAKNCRDPYLAAHAWARWGEQMHEHLAGQFSFALIDRRQGKVLAFTDHLGTLPFLYRMSGTLLTVAGDMRTMLHTVGCPRELNSRALRSFGNFDTLPDNPGECLHKGIYALPSASMLEVFAGRIRVRPYWQPSVQPTLVRSADIFEQARYLVEQAVSRHLDGRRRVAVMVSGGLDSSALVAAAAPLLRRKGLILLALGAVNDPAHGDIPDERSYMEKLRCFDNVELEFVDSAGRGPFDGIENPAFFETTPRLPVLRYLFDSVFRAASLSETDLLLHGGGGELGISSTPSARFLERAKRLQLRDLFGELRMTSAVSQISMTRLLAGEARRYYRRPAGRTVFFLNHAFQNGAPNRSRRYSPLWPDSAEDQLRTMANMRDRCTIGATQPPGYVFGYSCPLMDKDLLEFCLAVPPEFKARDGFGRHLVRRAFAPLLPPELIWRRNPMGGSPDYTQRYNRQLPKVREFVHSISSNDPVREIVDITSLENAITSIIEPWEAPGRSKFYFDMVSRVPATIGLINFLRQFSGFGTGC